MSPKERQLLQEMTEEMLQKGVIQPSSSPLASPIVLVKKKDGKQRFCIDSRKLNKETIRDVYPIPRIDDCLTALGGNQWFSTFDMHAGFWQIEMAATFQRYMDMVLAGLKWISLLVYLDDVCVFSKSLEQHLSRLEEAFLRFRGYNLKLNAAKCHVLKKEFAYLDHIVTGKGIMGDSKKIEAVQLMARPRNAKQLRSFLGLCNYYGKFIKNYGAFCAPFYMLLKTDFKLTAEVDMIFEQLKVLLAQTPMLHYPDFSKIFIVSTDASDDGIGAVLSQEDDEGQDRVIQYISRTLQEAERKWCVSEKEALAIIFDCETFRPYLYGSKFFVYTDHHSL